jgi:indolepyruvate ferredoxin oxidoreductase alpha subunit
VTSSRRLLSGNEAIARGVEDAGAALASAYPGTPSTEILENLAASGVVRSCWSPNEKVAVELVSGASLAGRRAFAAMKHVGVNVAADPLFTLAYTGVGGGLVVVTADDPELHSSQNEQDNRRYAHFARIPMLEPSDSQEAYDLTREAFSLSERFDLPVFLRTTTRVSHGKSVVVTGEPEARNRGTSGLPRNPGKFVMVPAHARVKHRDLEQRIARVAEWAETTPLNRIEEGESALGIVTAGASYNYVKEAFPRASVLKLATAFPLPERLIRRFAARVARLVVVEELEPVMEEAIRSWGIPCEGKSIIPRFGELDPGMVRRAIMGGSTPLTTGSTELTTTPGSNGLAAAPEGIPARPPILCVGCPHRGVFHVLSRRKHFVAGDIGCYTLAVAPPIAAIHSCLCMGAGVSQAAGIEAVAPEEHGKVVAVIGDSTFLHGGMPGVLNMAFNGIPATVLILDNLTTAMTGRQNHPGSGYDLGGNRTRRVDWDCLLRGLGIEHVRLVDAYDLAAIESALAEETVRPAPSVIVVRGACMLLRNQPVRKEPPYAVADGKCTNCGICLRIGCPAISREGNQPKGKPVIDRSQCTGCSLCFQVCRFDAIGREP